MNFGRMDRQITLQRVIETPDSLGATVQTWCDLATVWAQVVPLSGAELLRAGRQVAGEVSKFVIRFYSGLTAKDRISYGGKAWDILFLRELGRVEGYEITAEAHQ